MGNKLNRGILRGQTAYSLSAFAIKRPFPGLLPHRHRGNATQGHTSGDTLFLFTAEKEDGARVATLFGLLHLSHVDAPEAVPFVQLFV